jgi:hypothetical protein
MTANVRHLPPSMLYAAALSWLLIYEVAPYWGYMGYAGDFSPGGLVLALFASAILGLSIPVGFNARSMIVASLNYIFFIPTIVYMAFSDASAMYYFCMFTAYVGIYFLSRLNIAPLVIVPVNRRNILWLSFLLITLAIAVQAALGGLRHFNLNIERVYEFRSVAADEVPSVFGYIYSSIASVLIPITAALALMMRRYVLAMLAVALAVILFGMTHHKSVLFGPFAVVLLYIFFSKARSPYLLAAAFLMIPALAIAETLFIRGTQGADGIPYFTSLIVRRVLFTPAMLDTFFVEFFSENTPYYWSASRFGSWASENPYGVSAPFLIGIEYFSDPGTSANTGVIGSGFSNAGYLGVLFYSIAIGILIAVVNAYGKRIGHAVVAAGSFITVYYVVTTTDLLTAILTHGLLLLLVVLGLFSRQARRSIQGDRLPA